MSGLSADEKEALSAALWPDHVPADLLTAVERIITAREAEARRDERRKVAEEIAREIETRNSRVYSAGPYGEAYHDGYDDARDIAARIARAHLDPADARDDKEGR